MSRRQRNIRIGVDVAATALCTLGALLTLGDVHSPLRSGLVAAALVAGTGWAVSCWIELDEPAFAASVALAAGLSVYVFYALLFVEIGWWHPVGSVGGLLIGAASLNAAAILRDGLRRPVQ